jgi:hypothetical protein
MNILGIDNSFDLLIVCVTVYFITNIIFTNIYSLVEFILTKNEMYVDELVSEEKYFEDGDDEPYFKRLYKRTYNSGRVEYITSED